MKVAWTDEALADLDRLRDFLAARSPQAAERVVASLVIAPDRLLQNPRLGPPLEGFGDQDVRRMIVGSYEVFGEAISILRIWHTRENR